MLFNINTLEWDKELLDLFGVPKNIYNTKTPNEISDYYLNSFEQVHGCIKDGLIERIPSYGYH